MSTFHVLGLKITILLLIVLLPCIIIGGMITLCSFLVEKISEIKDGILYEKNTRNKKLKKVLWNKK